MSNFYISLDPGKTTGVCVHDLRTAELEAWEIGPEPHHLKLHDLLNGYGPELVICERFDYRRLDKVNLEPVEYIGVTKLWCQQTHTRYHAQMQLGHDRGLWTDSKLKELDLHQPGKPHANDAMRHMLYYLTVTEKDPQWIAAIKDYVQR